MTDPVATPLNVRYPLIDYQQLPGGCLLTGIILMPGRPQPAMKPDGSPVLITGLDGQRKPLMLPAEPTQHPICTWFVPGVYVATNVRHMSQEDKPENYRIWLVKQGVSVEEAGLVGPQPEAVETAPAEEKPAKLALVEEVQN